MSLKAMLWALDQPIAPTGRKFTLLVLAEHAGDHDGEDWTCCPSVGRICAFTAQRPRTVERHLVDLWCDGYISRQRRKVRLGKGSSKGVYEYVLHREDAARATLRLRREGRGATLAILAGVDDRQNLQELPPVSPDAPAKSGVAYKDEPSREPSKEPGARDPLATSGAAVARAGLGAEAQQSLPGKWTAVPAALRREICDVARKDDGWAGSYVDACGINQATGTIHPASWVAHGQLSAFVLRAVFKRHGLVLGDALPLAQLRRAVEASL